MLNLWHACLLSGNFIWFWSHLRSSVLLQLVFMRNGGHSSGKHMSQVTALHKIRHVRFRRENYETFISASLKWLLSRFTYLLSLAVRSLLKWATHVVSPDSRSIHDADIANGSALLYCNLTFPATGLSPPAKHALQVVNSALICLNSKRAKRSMNCRPQNTATSKIFQVSIMLWISV